MNLVTYRYISTFVCAQKVSWLSRYPDEDERVMVGGYIYIKVNSVRIIESNKNYQQTFGILSLFDRMVSDHAVYNKEVNKHTIKSVYNLLINKSKLLDPYITSMTQSYIRNKKTMAIRIDGLSEIAEHLIGFIFQNKVGKRLTARWNPKDTLHEDASDETELPTLYRVVVPSGYFLYIFGKLINDCLCISM